MNEQDYLETINLSEYDRASWEIKTQFEEISVPGNELDLQFTYEDIDFYYEEVTRPTSTEKESLRKALETLTEKQRDILDLHLQGLKQCDIAAKLGVCQATVSMTLNGGYDFKRQKRYGGVLAKLKHALVGKKCERCGGNIVGKSQRSRLCSKCSIRYTKKPLIEGECEVCGACFIGWENKRYCSNKCYHRASYLRRKKTDEIRECGVCGGSYTASYGRKYCSVRCQRRAAYLRAISRADS